MVAVQASSRKLREDLEHLVRESADVEDVLAFRRLSRRVRLEVDEHQPGPRIARAEHRPTHGALPFHARPPRPPTTGCRTRTQPDHPWLCARSAAPEARSRSSLRLRRTRELLARSSSRYRVGTSAAERPTARTAGPRRSDFVATMDGRDQCRHIHASDRRRCARAMARDRRTASSPTRPGRHTPCPSIRGTLADRDLHGVLQRVPHRARHGAVAERYAASS